MHKPRVIVCKGDGRVKVAKPVPWEVIKQREKKPLESISHLVLPRSNLFHIDGFYDNPQPIHRLVHRMRHC